MIERWHRQKKKYQCLKRSIRSDNISKPYIYFFAFLNFYQTYLENSYSYFTFIRYIYREAIHFFATLPWGFYVPSRHRLRIPWINLLRFDRATHPSFRLINTQNMQGAARLPYPPIKALPYMSKDCCPLLSLHYKPRWPVVIISKGKEMLHSSIEEWQVIDINKTDYLLQYTVGDFAYESSPVSRRLSY